MRVKEVSATSSLPVTLEEVKARARIYSDDDDSDLRLLIKAAVDKVEGDTLRFMVERTATFVLDYFYSPVVWFTRHPIQSIESIKYRDYQGVDTELTSYDFSNGGERGPACIRPSYNEVWPTTRQGDREAVTITAKVGWPADTSQSPADPGGLVWPELKLAVMYLCSTWYSLRETHTISSVVSEVPIVYPPLVQPNRLVI